MDRDKPHIQVPDLFTAAEGFSPVAGGGRKKRFSFAEDPARHGRRLRAELAAALPTHGSDDEGDSAAPESHRVTFISFPGLELALESLDSAPGKGRAELLGVKWELVDGESRQFANVYIPDGKRGTFFKKLDAYVGSVSAEGKRKNAKLVEGISSIRRASIRELWTDPEAEFPGDGADAWWEIWLRRKDTAVPALARAAKQHRLRIGARFLGFGDRIVTLVRGTPDDLAEAVAANDDVAELRRPHDISTAILALDATEQKGWVQDLAGRTAAAGPRAPAVCVVDCGVQQRHPLLAASLDQADSHVVDPTWKLAPTKGHGTEMAGLALYGDVEAAVSSTRAVRLLHRLESVKFLPDTGSNDPDLWGAVTAQAVDRPEIQAPARARSYLMAVTATSPEDGDGNTFADPGKPTSWSASVDALAYGRTIGASGPGFTYLDREEEPQPRLFVLSAGNIRDLRAADDHLARSDVEPVEDPAQAWNALTVGAFTEKDQMHGASPAFNNYTPIAPRGELSPVSRTSVLFERKKWPFKPEVVAEGGNWAVAPGLATPDSPENLAVLTTRLTMPGVGAFTSIRDTSAAAAQVAAIAADIQAAYPGFRPETVRALVVHSAEWTDVMLAHFPEPKAARVGLLRRYGMGVPDVSRACRSAGDALTLVIESVVRPYKREGKNARGKSREMNVHQLPWPNAELAALGEAIVRLRVTLSYFIEPNPSSRGWSGRYVYPSHGLRFATKRPVETLDNFRMRINEQARVDGKKPQKYRTETGWFFGSDQQQAPGSLHTDIWEGTAQDLAAKGAIVVYPVAGWWKSRPDFDQSDDGVHYSLIVSIESPEVATDLWTPVAQAVAAQIAIIQ